MSRPRWFVAHRKGIELPALETLRAGIRFALVNLGNVEADLPELVLGIEDFDRHFAECGSWDAWALAWAVGTEPDPDNPVAVRARYQAIVVPSRVDIRRATGKALKLAMRQGKPVFWFCDNYIDGTGEPLGAKFFPAKCVVQTGGNEQWPTFTLGF